MLKVIIAGGRDFSDYDLLSKTLSHLKKPFEVVCGEAKGADSLGKRYAAEHGLTVHSFPQIGTLTVSLLDTSVTNRWLSLQTLVLLFGTVRVVEPSI